MFGNLFVESDVQLIYSIPISGTNQEDRQIWRGTKNGLISIKNAYYIQMELEEKGVAGSSTQKEVCGVWRGMWGLKIPNVEKKNYGEHVMTSFKPVPTYIGRRL